MFTPRACRNLFVAGWLILFNPAVPAAEVKDNWLWQAWQTEEGLPDNSVAGVAQTADGYLWVGTPTGLARFDGLQFETISLTNLIALPNRGIITMLRGRHDALWLAMDRGAVVRLSGNSSRTFVTDLPNHLPNNITEDAEGNLWIAYRGGTVYRISEKQTLPITAQNGLPNGFDICALTSDLRGRVWFAKSGQIGVVSNGVFSVLKRLEAQPMRLAAGRDGGIWVCCGFHLYKFDGQEKMQDFGEFHPENSGTVATVMLEDHEGNVWIGTSFSGLYCCNTNGFQSIATSHNGILSLVEDREGNIWAGTSGGGLNRIRRRAIMLETGETGLPFPSIDSICEATNGTIWAATQNGVLVYKTSDRWNPIPTDALWPGDATCVAADTHGGIWVGTRAHGIYYWRDGKFNDLGGVSTVRGSTIHTLLVSRSGDLWMGQESPSAILRLREGEIKSFPLSPAYRVIRAMVEDAAGNIWAGTSRGNLLRVSGETVSDATPRSDSRLASIRCLCVTANGALWIGYAGWGVGCLKDGHYTEVNTAQGLLDNYISHIVEDDNGWLWFGANRGIFKVRQKDFDEVAAERSSRVRSVHYGRGDGLPSLQGTFGDSPDVLRSRDGRLWIPMQTALAVVDPSSLNEQSKPQPFLTRISVDDNVVAEYQGIVRGVAGTNDKTVELTADSSVLRLPPNHHSLKFEFIAPNFIAPEKIVFRHRLDGLEDRWIDAGTVRTATYSRLDNGSYDFQVAARSSDGEWNASVARIHLVVAPFFWQAWWFRLAVFVIFTLSIVAIVRYVSFRRLHAQLHLLEQQAALQKERARIAKDIHDDLGANLTQIAFLGELARQDLAEPAPQSGISERIGIISATARAAIKSLDEIVWAVNPRNDTLAHLLNYAGQFALDYLHTVGIRCRLDFPTDVPQRELSSDLRHNLFLVIKEALHNIFKHANATEVWLRAIVDAHVLEICVEDNGRGFVHVPDDALADGLRNMHQRMVEIGGSFHVESQPGAGTKIFVRLPWSKTGDRRRVAGSDDHATSERFQNHS